VGQSPPRCHLLPASGLAQRGAVWHTPEQAFYVKCDAELNPPEIRDLGQLIIEVGMAPVKPAEFVIFRISQWAGANAKRREL
jgi:uncharacterized protein